MGTNARNEILDPIVIDETQLLLGLIARVRRID